MKQTIQKWIPRRYGGPLLSAGILSLSCIHYRSGFLVLIGLIPIIEFLYRNKNNRRTTILGLWLCGFVFYGIILGWMPAANLENWSEITPTYKLIISTFVWFITTLSLSSTFLFAGVGTALLRPFRSMRYLFIIVPSLWILSEYAGSWFLSLIMWAPDVNLNAFYVFGHLELPVASTPLVYLSRFIGTYGLAFAAVLINVAIWYGIRSRKWKPAATVLAILALISGAAFIIKPSPETPIRAAVRQLPSIGIQGIAGLGAAAQHASAASQKPADILVLPEFGSVFNEKDNAEVTKILDGSLKNKNALVVYGSSEKVDQTHITSGVTASTITGKSLASQEKTYLVPNGEYIPTFFRGIIRFFGLSSYIKDYSETQRGTSDPTPYMHQGVRYGTLFCSASIAPSFYRSISGQGAEVLTNSGSLAFTTSSLIHGHMQEALRLSAVANAKPMLASTRGGHAYIIDHNGTFMAQTRDITGTLLYGTVQPTKGKTLYSQLGEYMLAVAFGALVIVVALDRRRGRSGRKSS